MVSFIDRYREEHGVEPICNALPIAPSTYYAAKNPKLSARAVPDAVLMQILMALWVATRKVYGAHKLWKAARRAGHDIGRDQVARLMAELGIRGVSRRRKRVFTTRQDPNAARAADLVNRDFTATRPDTLWIMNLTHLPTRSGMAYVCFIVDAFSRRIVGWRVASNMATAMVLDALEMVRRSRGSKRSPTASDTTKNDSATSNAEPPPVGKPTDDLPPTADTSLLPAPRLAGQGYDNALAETVNGLYKTECVYGPDANGWDNVSQVKLETLSWAHRYNHQRLHNYCDDIPPAEFETAFYAAQQTDRATVGNQ